MKLKEAIDKYKLDRRRNWFAFCGNIVYDFKFTNYCSYCTNGCGNCGYTGKLRTSCPVPAMNENNEPIKITDKDFTYAK